ncbi:hypothetical protein [Rhodococcus oxybenzonivorans]|uniref:hypothetical protein n=1 Tax=Rhodococcus TaxID=1827 RepID=UPI0037CBD94B
MRVTAARIAEMPYHFAGRQRVFETIGPCTRAGFFTRNGELLTIKQDVGHRNAVGKLIRWATERNRVPLGHRAEPSPAEGEHSARQFAGVVRAGVESGDDQHPDPPLCPRPPCRRSTSPTTPGSRSSSSSFSAAPP